MLKAAELAHQTAWNLLVVEEENEVLWMVLQETEGPLAKAEARAVQRRNPSPARISR